VVVVVVAAVVVAVVVVVVMVMVLVVVVVVAVVVVVMIRGACMCACACTRGMTATHISHGSQVRGCDTAVRKIFDGSREERVVRVNDIWCNGEHNGDENGQETHLRDVI
jgi:hypothetical protein